MKLSLPITIVLYGILLPTHSATSAPCQAQSASAEPLALTAAEITQLINECGKRTTQMTARLANYAFRFTETDFVIDKKGGLKSEQSKAFEVYPIAVGKIGRAITVQVSENGVPLSPEKIARERERAAKETMELQQKAAQAQSWRTWQNPRYQAHFNSVGIRVEKHSGLFRYVWAIKPTDFLVSHDFFAPRRVSLEGREAVVLSFRPRPNYVYDETNIPFTSGTTREDYARAMSHLGGRIWIDTLDKVIVRLEAKAFRELSKLNDTSDVVPDSDVTVLFEFMRLENGTWVPRFSKINTYGSAEIFWKTPYSRSQKYSDYQLFQTTVEVKTNEAVREKP